MADNTKFGGLLVSLAAILLVSFTTSVCASDLLTKEKGQDVLRLGKIEVEGTPTVLRVLQIIKQGLHEPYSNDPKLANVVVCRLNEQAGSHIHQTLICATNRAFSTGRDALHTASASSHASQSNATCTTTTCLTVTDEQTFSVLNETLNSLPGQYLETSVDGAEFRKLLDMIPDRSPHAEKTQQPDKTSQHPADKS